MINIAVLSINIYAQNPIIDSLKIALKHAKHDTTRCNILNQLTEAESDDKLWPIYNDELAELASKNLKAEPGNVFYLKKLAAALGNKGYQYARQSNVQKASAYYHRALKIQESIDDKLGIANNLNNIGFGFVTLGDIDKALNYYHRSLKILEEIKDMQGLAYLLNNIGHVYENQGDKEKALEYYHRSLAIREKIDDKQGIGQSLVNIGYIYDQSGNLTKAMEYYLRSLEVRESISDRSGVANSLNNIGNIYYARHEPEKALNYHLKALAIRKDISDKKGISSSLHNIASAYLKVGKTGQALKSAQESMQIAQTLGFPEYIINAALTLKKIYESQNKHKEALEMAELHTLMRDSISNENTRKLSVKKQFQYEYEKQAAADSVKHAEEQKVINAQLGAQAASLKQERTQRYALYGGLILVITFFGFVFNRYRVAQKQKKIIEAQKVLVDSAYDSLHEKNKEVLDSIHYAKRIQGALLTPEVYIERTLNRLNGN
ncbi:MAG: protein serine/threonine phosphatase [Bacteroidetes bacterium]|nr:protein serine/threonine phosphatase [Bacteroidota bacterium]MDF2452937.1 protein serine/threonine phosphatase [Bacteroidota bacterium]